MLSKLKQNLTSLLMMENSDSAQEKVWDPASAATALLIEAARADNHVDALELAQIERSLINILDVDAIEIKQKLAVAEIELNQATCLHELTSIINADWSFGAKLELIEAMWKVVLSDHQISSHEQHLMRKIKGLLHIPQSEYIVAKLRAQNSLASNAAGDDD